MLIVVHLIELKINPGLFSFRNHLGHGLTMSIVGRSERSDLRHGTLNEIRHVGGRSARSDLQYSLFTITCVK